MTEVSKFRVNWNYIISCKTPVSVTDGRCNSDVKFRVHCEKKTNGNLTERIFHQKPCGRCYVRRCRPTHSERSRMDRWLTWHYSGPAVTARCTHSNSCRVYRLTGRHRTVEWTRKRKDEGCQGGRTAAAGCDPVSMWTRVAMAGVSLHGPPATARRDPPRCFVPTTTNIYQLSFRTHNSRQPDTSDLYKTFRTYIY